MTVQRIIEFERPCLIYSASYIGTAIYSQIQGHPNWVATNQSTLSSLLSYSAVNVLCSLWNAAAYIALSVHARLHHRKLYKYLLPPQIQAGGRLF